ncbi:VOC family protein [Sulfuricystis multivorans]|uniref:VOC family protein n=1 Tax=Sulfuricystis multivorans TaxID=2211108 RepID=UPI000F829A55|nr:VOC family protein [Sulfuricystis multivorans]
MIFDHIGIFVSSLEEGRRQLWPLGIRDWTEAVEDRLQKVTVAFGYDDRGLCYEIIAPLGEGGPVTPVLRSGRNILNHVAYRVADLDQTVQDLRSAGSMPLGEAKPAAAFAGRRIVFVLTPLRMILELIEDAP